ncbi:MAG: outer membrane receptor protein involved in Fe transport [Verrucomicrobiales bacterium]|jgi:outer membrane receptor protein involved in Fe transport
MIRHRLSISRLCGIAIAMNLMAACLADDSVPFVILPDVVVVAERRSDVASSSRQWDSEELEKSNALTVDAILKQDPAFSLYRRQSSQFGNPTSAGVSLRRTGATATSRTLVLRDGIPQNDPFGGWISWTRYNAGALESARLVPAAAASVWGNQSPAGVVQLTSRSATESGGRISSSIGNHETWAASAAAELVSNNGKLAVLTNAYTLQSEGFYGLLAYQRGNVDRTLDIDVRGLDLKSIWQPESDLTLEATLSLFEEERGNGTLLSRNSTEAVDLSLRGTWETETLTTQALAYYQQRDFAALFSSVNPQRSAETPALDQFDVPGTGLGGGITTSWDSHDLFTITAGTDVRHLTGETNENAGFVNGEFLRRRRAGGEAAFAGAFARAEWTPDSGPKLDLSGRIDYWSLTDGERIERRPSTSALLRHDDYADRDGFEPSLSLTLQQDVGETLTFTGSASSSFRAPTLNELYRPFRVRSDITEANPGLEPERFYSLDASAVWDPAESFSFSNTFFVHWIHDAIANVPVTDSSVANDLGVFVPPGGTLQQRDNVNEARVMGIETKASWQPSDLLNASLAYQLTETKFTDSSDQSLLNDQEFPQSPGHQATLSLSGRPLDRLEWFLSTTYSSEAFDDALASRPLDPYWNTSLGLALEVNDHLTVRAHVENVFDEEIQSGRASNGLTSIGQPRSFWITTTLEW